MEKAYKSNVEWDRNWLVVMQNLSCINIKEYKGKLNLQVSKNKAFPCLISDVYKRRKDETTILCSN